MNKQNAFFSGAVVGLALVFLFGCSMKPKHLKFSAYPSEIREAVKRDGFTLQSIKVTWTNELGADTYKWP